MVNNQTISHMHACCIVGKSDGAFESQSMAEVTKILLPMFLRVDCQALKGAWRVSYFARLLTEKHR